MPNALQSLDVSYACRLHIERAQRSFPSLPLVAALVAEANRTRGGLTKSSVGVYIHDHRLIMRRLVEAGLATQDEAREALASIVPALERRHDAKVPARTSGNKSTTLTARELKTVFAALKSEALAGGKTWMALVALLVASLSVLGARPIEMTTLTRSGPYLRIQTAKRSARAAPYRVYDARRVPESWIAAMVMVAEILAQEADVDVDGFYRLLRHLSQILGRTSKAVIGRRICSYTLRHVTLATWKRACISPDDIALLAGHISVRTARHYAPARSGHVGPVVIAPVAPALVPEGVFTDMALSPLMRPPRGPRRRDWSTMTSTAGASRASTGESDMPEQVRPNPGDRSARVEPAKDTHAADRPRPLVGRLETSAVCLPTASDESPRSANDPPAPDAGAPAGVPGTGLMRADQPYRPFWMRRGVPIMGPDSRPSQDPPVVDEFDLSDMPVPTAPRAPSRSLRTVGGPLSHENSDYSALEDLIATFAEPGGPDLVLPADLAMPLPYDDDARAPRRGPQSGAATAQPGDAILQTDSGPETGPGDQGQKHPRQP